MPDRLRGLRDAGFDVFDGMFIVPGLNSVRRGHGTSNVSGPDVFHVDADFHAREGSQSALMEIFVASSPVNSRPVSDTPSYATYGTSLFLPTTGALVGGLVLRIQKRRAAELLAPNPFGAGILVIESDKPDSFGFIPTAFDRVLIRQIIALDEPDAAAVRARFFAVMATGFAGREAQRLGRAAMKADAVRRDALLRKATDVTRGASVSFERLEWLVSVLLCIGADPDAFAERGNDDLFRRSVPARLQIIREGAACVRSRLQALDCSSLNTERVMHVAEEAFARIETLYEGIALLLDEPARLRRIALTGGELNDTLGTLEGWLRFALLLREIPHAPVPSFALSELSALAQVLAHKNSAIARTSALISTVRPNSSSWPPEVDQALYYTERNERLVREAVICDAKGL